MYAKQIRRLMLAATFATVPIAGMAGAAADAGQAADAQKQTEAAKGSSSASATGSAATGSAATGSAASGQGQKGGAANKAPETVLMLVPIVIANKENSMKSGCWARIYSRANYMGDTMTLSGPIAIADMTGPFGLDWDDKVDSVEVGPKATLAVFDNEQFRDQVALFKPGQKVPDISKKLGFFDEFASVRLSCSKS